ncbi:MAG TPA: arylsulfatase [Terrimicrobiaceae bacterium]|nr:arylsulfatase [Terrimicrobiaceae bacterium]
MSRSNFIFIIADQMRADCLGTEKRHDIDTPNLDYLATRGSRFSHAYSPCPSCIPARASMMTGMDPWHAGILGMGDGQGPIPSDYPHTLAGEFTKAGYQTHLSGKGHFHPTDCKLGFETISLDESGRHEVLGREDDYRKWFRENAPAGVTPGDPGITQNSWMARPWHAAEHLHPSAWTMMDALEFLKQRDGSRPFFLNISFARPHSPYTPPEYYFRSYEGRVKQPIVGDWAAKHDQPGCAVDINAWHGQQSPRNNALARMGYFGDVSFIDTQIGRLLTTMGRLYREALLNTWFVFVSDHGDMLGDHHLWRKTYAYEGSSRVPLIIKAPETAGLQQRQVVDEPVALCDIMPSLLAAADLEIPRTVTGRNLLECLETSPREWREYVHGEHDACYSPEEENQFLTNGRRKFIWLPRVGLELFFDLEQDPDEMHNLIDDPARAGEIAIWRQRLICELQSRDCGWCSDDELTFTKGPLRSPFLKRRYGG